jgi:MYXO-CTERM domain-containing protein
MDFIERVFGLSPDGGSGWFEFLLFAIPLAGIAWLWRRRRNRQPRNDADRRYRR